MLNNTAILIFSRTPEKEISFKTFAESPQNNFALCNNLYLQTIKTAAKTKLPIIFCGEKEQRGDNFAEKITNAICQGFSNGFTNLIIIGGDCPNLTKNEIGVAYKKLLEGNDIVAGKDHRGGIYLLGINKNAFKETAFLQFKWQTNKIFSEIAAYSSGFNFSKLKSVLFDINSKKDAVISLSLFKINISFKKLLSQVFTFFKNLQIQKFIFIKFPTFSFTQILRGPPSFVSL
jgi:uncharacterized protein